MNRIPTEGLKRGMKGVHLMRMLSLNEQNPDRGIETHPYFSADSAEKSLNEQNPDRGIETLSKSSLGLAEQ